MIKNGATIRDSRVLILGITFKENCPDIRNSRVIDIIKELETYQVKVDVYDPWASKAEVQQEYGIDLISSFSEVDTHYDAIILAVSHDAFVKLDLKSLKAASGVIFDVKSFFPKALVDARL